MKRNVRIFVQDIEECIETIEEYMDDISEATFFGERRIQDAVLRRLEIIGEAVKNLPLEFREKYPDIDWKRIAGLRDVLIHVYFGVNLERVWVIVKDDLPDLKKKIKNILDEMGRDKD